MKTPIEQILRTAWLALAGAAIAAAAPSRADVALPSVFGDHMVLQRGIKAPVWGTATPGESVRVTIGTRSASATADSEGKWMVRVGPMQPGSPLTMTVTAPSGRRTYTDVLVGDVWICSGQSNMEMGVGSAKNAQQEIETADLPGIRLLTVPKESAPAPAADFAGAWQVCSPSSVHWFSAAAFFFGRELHARLGVPIGLIHTSWGGTPAESWTSLKWLSGNPILTPMLERIPKDGVDVDTARREYERKLVEYRAQQYMKDPGNNGFRRGWADPTSDGADWREARLPGPWETAAQPLKVDGAVWYRRTLSVPEEWAGKDLTLELGAIDDFDTTYFNGTQVGATDGANADAYALPRKYTVPGSLVRAGPNTIAVRVFDWYGGGGFTGPAEAMRLLPSGPGVAGQIVDLAGAWEMRVEVTRNESDVPPAPQEPPSVWNSWTPTGLYNAMIAPLIPYGIKGAIWYQGESNAGRAFQYRTLFPAMIRCWRDAWGQGDFPFFWVQLANFTARNAEPVDSDWAELREAQTMTLALRKTGMAVAIDIGEAADIHPKNKQDVGLRLAVAARHVAYGQRTVVPCGPIYRSMSIRGNAIVLRFRNAQGLNARDGRLEGFSIAGSDHKFAWADARIEADTVVVSSPSVSRPLAVRYAWANNPAATLFNGAGLPASPFRTDAWPGITVKAR